MLISVFKRNEQKTALSTNTKLWMLLAILVLILLRDYESLPLFAILAWNHSCWYRGDAMGARFRSWWQQIKKYRVTILVVAIILVVILTLIIVGYRFDWTGFNGNNKSGKTLWDWLQLLIIPLALAVIALMFQLANTRTERQIAKQRYEQDQQIALDKQREDLLQAYLDRMSELLLEKNLRSSAPDSEVRNVARVRTVGILIQLDKKRVGYVFAFLREAGLIEHSTPIVSLSQTNLTEVNWERDSLGRATLSEANLRWDNLSWTYLHGANLSGANISQASLSRAVLNKADLSGARLEHTDLSGASLREANLSNANLSDVDFTGANLSRATVTEEQLKKVKSLKRATMPDGSKHL
jgi:uncharacterized protein YjbI with pentapeptide repeats